MADGRAYGFFTCNVTFPVVRVLLHSLRYSRQSPSLVDVWMIDSTARVKDDLDLARLAHQAMGAGRKYFADAIQHEATNKDTAVSLYDLLNEMHRSRQTTPDDPLPIDVYYKNGMVYELLIG